MTVRFLLAASLPHAPAARQQPPAQPRGARPRRRPSTITASSPPIRTIRSAYTQGLFFLDGQLYESTGQVGQSTIRRVSIADGRVLQSVPIPPGQFGEGIVNWGDQIISITWQGGIGYRWDRADAAPARRMALSGRRLGPDPERHRHHHERRHAELRFLDPGDAGRAAARHRHPAAAGRSPISTSSNGSMARSSPTSGRRPIIVRIDPASGRVTGMIDLRPLAAGK